MFWMTGGSVRGERIRPEPCSCYGSYPLRFSPQVIDKRVAVRAPPPDRDGVLPAHGIADPDISPEHMPAPGLRIPRNGPAVIRAGRACAHMTNPYGTGTINVWAGWYCRPRPDPEAGRLA